MKPDNTVRQEIDRLVDLDLLGLRRRWLELYETEAPLRMSRELLVQAIAYRLQEAACGGLSRASKAKLSSHTDERSKRQIRVDRSVRPGTRLIREWNGRTIDVVADATGAFVYRGKAYRSLSAIACEVTGTRWSGPAFFGLDAHRTRRHDQS